MPHDAGIFGAIAASARAARRHYLINAIPAYEAGFSFVDCLGGRRGMVWGFGKNFRLQSPGKFIKNMKAHKPE